jgi:hypothetical protein
MSEDIDLEEREELEQQPGRRRVWRVLLGLALSGILGVILGVGAYFSLPFLYNQIVSPIQDTYQQVEELERRVSLLEETQEATLLVIEAQQEINQEKRSTLDQRLDRIDDQLANLTDTLENQVQKIDSLRVNQLELASVQQDLDTLTVTVGRLQAAASGESETERSLDQEMTIVEVMLLLFRARLWLVENNVGSAITEIQNARTLLQQASEMAPEGVDLIPVLDRLDLALDELESSPLVAVDDLEIAWKLLQEMIVKAESSE